MPQFVRAAALAGLATLLAACGGVHPGAAAVVDGTEISIGRVDDAAGGWCTVRLLSAAQQGVSAVDNTEVRRQVVADLVTLEVARGVIADLRLTVPADQVVIGAGAQREVENIVEPDDVAGVLDFLAVNNEIRASVIAIGEHLTGEDLDEDNSEQIAAAGQEALVAAIDDADIDIDPRFGLDDGIALARLSGSLSASASGLPRDLAELPETQRCA